MALTVHLLGSPRIERDLQDVAPPRGNKSWALLAYLARNGRPVSRERLSSMLFADADDPMGALRWNLSQLRRVLGDHLNGDPVRLELPADAVVDVDVLTRGSWVEAVDLPGLGGEFLEGMHFAQADGLQLWLDAERRHLAQVTHAVLREAALARLARGDTAGAVDLATRMVTRDPLDENARVVLVRCLRAAGRVEDAHEQVREASALIRRELGVEPGSALTAAAGVPGSGDTGALGRATVLAQLEAGQAAMSAGALEAGIDSLRRATVAARGGGHRDLLCRALVDSGAHWSTRRVEGTRTVPPPCTRRSPCPRIWTIRRRPWSPPGSSGTSRCRVPATTVRHPGSNVLGTWPRPDRSSPGSTSSTGCG